VSEILKDTVGLSLGFASCQGHHERRLMHEVLVSELGELEELSVQNRGANNHHNCSVAKIGNSCLISISPSASIGIALSVDRLWHLTEDE
jgi:hypothetical protein